jgi:hypothetical protein
LKTAGKAPVTATMSAWGVMSWIAFQEVRPRPGSNRARWGGSDVRPLLKALEARAAVEPHYIVQPLVADGLPWDGKSYTQPAFSPAAPLLLRQIRARARQREGRLVSFQELAVILRGDINAAENDSAKIRKARHALLEALRISKLTAWGKRDPRPRASSSILPSRVTYSMVGDVITTPQYEQIPAAVFIDDLVTIDERDDVGAYSGLDEYRGPAFRKVRFHTSEVLGLWPPDAGYTGIGPSKSVGRAVRRHVGGRPPKYDWEGFWVEVAWYAAANDLERENRTELQRHMRDWTDKRWDDPPDDATIRARLRRLYDGQRDEQS